MQLDESSPMDSLQLAPWFFIWRHPRGAIRKLLETYPPYTWFIVISLSLFISESIKLLSYESSGFVLFEIISLPFISRLLIGALLSFGFFYFNCLVIKWLSSKFGLKPNLLDIRTAVACSYYVSTGLRLIQFALSLFIPIGVIFETPLLFFTYYFVSSIVVAYLCFISLQLLDEALQGGLWKAFGIGVLSIIATLPFGTIRWGIDSFLFK